MRVALLLPGFIRKIDNLKVIKRFIELNKHHTIDIYSITYEILGQEYREVKNESSFLNSQKVDKNIAKKYFKFKKFKIESYDKVNKELDVFVQENIQYIKKASPSVWKEWGDRMNCNYDESGALRGQYAQWRGLYNTFRLIKEEYDCVIRSRYDTGIDHLNLDNYDMDDKTIYFKWKKTKNLHRATPGLTLKDGRQIKIPFDSLWFGSHEVMNVACQFGSKDVMTKILKDKTYTAVAKQNEVKDIKLSNEATLYYWLFHLNNFKEGIIDEKDCPYKLVLVRRRKYPETKK